MSKYAHPGQMVTEYGFPHRSGTFVGTAQPGLPGQYLITHSSFKPCFLHELRVPGWEMCWRAWRAFAHGFNVNC